MSIFINNIPVFIDFFHHLRLVHKINDQQQFKSTLTLKIDQSANTIQLSGHLLWVGLALNNASFDITIRLINVTKVLLLCSAHKVFIITGFLASSQLIFGGFYFAAAKMSHQFFFEFSWKWPAVLTGHNDEQLFHVCASFGLSPGFKLMEMETQSSHVFSALALTVKFINKF